MNIDEKLKCKRNPCAECDPSDTCLNCRYGFLMSIISDIPKNRLEEICTAEKDRRLHISPVEDGTTIFYIEKGGPFTNHDYDTVQPASYYHGLTERTYGKLDEKWWRTREEAEATLAINRNIPESQ